MADREKIALETLAEVLHSEFSKSLGRDASDFMPRIGLRACDGDPNWDATIGVVGVPVLTAFLEATSRLKATYDLDNQSHGRLPRLA